MSNFTEQLTLTFVENDLWKTDRAFTYYIGEEDSEDSITVPKGFITDLASVPWPASMLIPKSGQYNQAAVLHDFLYSVQTRSRIECDLIFKEAMTVLGVNWFKRNIMYRAVRIGGWLPWDKKKSKNRE